MKPDFRLEANELIKFDKWNIEHEKMCRFVPTEENPFAGGAIGGRLTYSFTPTSLGLITVVSCACGEEANLTDYSNW